MRSTPYQSIPFALNWLKDSSVPIARRSADPALKRIDSLVGTYNFTTCGASKKYLLGELYFVTNWWLRNFRVNHQMDDRREPAIRYLCRCTIRLLADAFHCGVSALPTELEKFYGREMNFHGHKIDAEKGSQYYLSRAEAEKYKLVFMNHKFYQFPWWRNAPLLTEAMVPAESKYAYYKSGNVNRNAMAEEWGFFVMSMSRDLYMAAHHDDFCHSAYLSGSVVQCAGSMLIKDGIIKGIRNDSGHYHPSDAHLVNLLQHLQMLGYKLKDIKVFDFKGLYAETDGDVFFRNKGNWQLIQSRAEENAAHIQKRLDLMKDPRSRWNALVARQVTLHDLVERQFAELKKNPTNRYTMTDEGIWKRAYQETCGELGMFDPAWSRKVNYPPIPRKTAKQQAKQRPQIPRKDNRPKINPRTGRPS
jgi:hypothetical protein